MPGRAPQPPRAPRRRRAAARRRAVVLAAVVGVVAAVGLVWALAVLAGSGDVEVRLGDDRFRAGRVDRLAAEIDERGPFLVPDASPSRSRDIYVQHLGDDESAGWLAFAARVEGAERRCTLQWDGDVFVDPCTGERHPADGEGLTHYPTRIEDGVLFVDLRPSR